MPTPWRAALLIASAAVLVSACSSDDGPTSAPTTTATTAPGPADRAAVDRALGTVGLAIARELAVPGTADVVFTVTAAGDEAIDTWRALRDLVGTTGRHPVIAGAPMDPSADATDLDRLLGFAPTDADDPRSVEHLLARYRSIDVDAWFGDRPMAVEIAPDALDAAPPLPRAAPQDTFTTGQPAAPGEPVEDVEIALLPTRASWEAPVYLQWGGWNLAPAPEELSAIFAWWHEQHGAEVVAMTLDVVELAVERPPSEDDAAIALAREQLLVAPDIVWQGTQDVEVLAASLVDAPVWFLWWD